MTKGPATCTAFSPTLRKRTTAAPLYKERAAAAAAFDLESEDIGMKAVSRHATFSHALDMMLGSPLRLPVTHGSYEFARSRICQLRPNRVVWNWRMVLWSSLVEVEHDTEGELRQETWYCVCGSCF